MLLFAENLLNFFKDFIIVQDVKQRFGVRVLMKKWASSYERRLATLLYVLNKIY